MNPLVFRVAEAGKWHWPDESLSWLGSACASWLLLARTGREAYLILDGERCGTAGCRERWAAFDRTRPVTRQGVTG